MNALERVYMHPGEVLQGRLSFDSVKRWQNLTICDFWHVRDKTVQVKLTNKSSSTAIKSSCIDMNQSLIESLDNFISHACLSAAVLLLVHKL
jgi:hypothetical protein